MDASRLIMALLHCARRKSMQMISLTGRRLVLIDATNYFFAVSEAQGREGCLMDNRPKDPGKEWTLAVN